jgi:hypothetical protein
MALLGRFDTGQKVRSSVTFRDIDGAIADPTGIVAKYESPAEAETTKTYGSDAEVVKSATGKYYIDVTLSSAGTWYLRWNGTGTVVAAVEDTVIANGTVFA